MFIQGNRKLKLYFGKYSKCFGRNKLKRNQLNVSVTLSKAKGLYEKTQQ